MESSVRTRLVQLRALSYGRAAVLTIASIEDLDPHGMLAADGAHISLTAAFSVFPDGTCSAGVLAIETDRGKRAQCTIAKGRCGVECDANAPGAGQ